MRGSFAAANQNCSMYQRWLFLLVPLFLLLSFTAGAQKADSVQLTLADAERIFLQKNLSLLAQQYNVDISRAMVQQATYWDNPILATDQNIYDGKFFRHNKDFGQVYIQLQQLIKTAGKRNKQLQLAKDDVLTAQQQFNDLMRNLRFVLRNDFSSLNLQIRTWRIYISGLASLEKLVAGMDAQLQAGNISQKDNIRVKALLYSLQADAAALQQQIADTEKEFAVLLQVNGDTVFVPQRDDSLQIELSYSLPALLDSARVNRPDIQLARTNLYSQQHNLSYQKALAVPDVTVSTEYDQRSSYVNNFWGLGIAVPIPILNKNKGNIRAARIAIQQADAQILQVQNAVQQDVIAAYHKFMTIQQLQRSMGPGFIDKYNQLMKNMVQSYQQRQISLLEFIDFFDAWKEAVTKQLEQQNSLQNVAEELNYSTGTTVINVK